MRKNVFGRQFKRDTNERKALFKGLLSALVLRERIQTTEEKAKAIKARADKIVTIGKKDRLHAASLLQQYLVPEAIKKLLNDIAPRFEKRHGGYTTLARLGTRMSDRASMAVLEWVEKEKPETTKTQNEDETQKKKTQKLSVSEKLSASAIATKPHKKTVKKRVE